MTERGMSSSSISLIELLLVGEFEFENRCLSGSGFLLVRWSSL
ncbi:MAG: hypothetical protein JWM11_2759 [Planctomycetaceae bacterium]|nr:hypothetical protein [Planctomycetaceae bacterium]